jgi:hypothetical protein
MNFTTLLRTLGLFLALLLPAVAHANFEGTRASYPHDNKELVSTFREGYYRLLYKDGAQQRTVIVTKNTDGTFHVQGATESATLGVYRNTNGTCVMFINEDGSDVYAYFLATCNTSGVITAYDSSLAARRLLNKRVPVKIMPKGTAAANKQFLQQLGARRQTFKPLFTATPIKMP